MTIISEAKVNRDQLTTSQILSDSKQMVSALKANLKKDIESFIEKEIEEACKQPNLPPAPKSPRMKLPADIPEPDGTTTIEFKVPTSPRK